MRNISIYLIALIVSACTSGDRLTDPAVNEAKTKEVLDHHIQTFKQNDLEGVMADYTEESVLITPDRTFTGLVEIRENFVGAFEALPAKGTTMTVTKSVVSKDVAYMVWEASTPTLEFKYATDTFIVQNGKIVRQTYAGLVTPVVVSGEAITD